MPRLSDMFPSKYLKAADFGEGDQVVTIDHLEEDNVGQGRDAKDVWVLYFRELEKPLILNKTNTSTIAKLYGDDTDDWIGKRVALFATEVQFQSEMVEAIRIRSKPPRVSLRKAAAAGAVEDRDETDPRGKDVPF